MTAPPVALAAISSDEVSAAKAGDFANMMKADALSAQTKNAKIEVLTVGSCKVTVSSDPDDGDRKVKLKSVESAFAKVQAAGFTIPDTSVILSGKPGVRCITYKSNAEGGNPPVMFLGSQIVEKNPAAAHSKGIVQGDIGTKGERGVANVRYDEDKEFFGSAGLSAQAEAVVVHELGHIMHEAQNPVAFWREKTSNKSSASLKGMADAGSSVSQYATKGPLEFVAEVFTALIYGKAVPVNSLRWYDALNGPKAAGFYTPPPPIAKS